MSLSIPSALRSSRSWPSARTPRRERSPAHSSRAFDELGSAGWAEEVHAELERVGGRRPQRESELTPAERRVVELAANGASNKEIALALFVSVHTVETHLTHSYAKLGVRSRAQLASRSRFVGRAKIGRGRAKH